MQTEVSNDDKLIWSALEYEERDRSRDWFWALGVIVVTASLAAIIFENYFFAGLIIIAGALLGFYAIKKPELVTYELNPKGLVIHNRLYPYENIKSFWVQADFNPGSMVKPILFVQTERVFLPVFTLPIDLDIAEEIHNIFSSQNIPELEMHEHPSDRIMDILGF